MSARAILNLLLLTSKFEIQLQTTFEKLLAAKQDLWDTNQSQAAQNTQEISEYFSGERLLTKVEKDQNYQDWFLEMSAQVALNVRSGV